MTGRRRAAVDGGEGRWLTTYGDIVTLLLAFFVMLYAMSQVDVQKFEELVGGLEGPFGNTSMREELLDTGTGIVGEAGTIDALPGNADLPVPQASPAEELDRAELASVRDELATALAAVGLDPEASLVVDERGLVVSLATDELLFPSGSPELTARGREIVAAVAPVLAGFDNSVSIEGHTDDVPLDRGGYTNWNLSSDRALAVLRLLTDLHGIAPERLSTAAFGEFRPAAPNDSDEGRARNRRVALVIFAAEESPHG